MDAHSKLDILVVGAGPAGLAFARSLAGAGLQIALIERDTEAVLADPAPDGREIALTHRSQATLERLGVWQRIAPETIAPLRQAQVFDGQQPFALSFTGAGPEDRLGALVSNHRIRRALYESIAGQTGLRLFAGSAIRSVRTSAKSAEVTFEDGRTLSGRLVIGADSRFSFVRRQLEIGAKVNKLGRSMLLCRVRHEQEHRGIATEWFGHGQTIAMLPLTDPHTSSAVLTLPAGSIMRLVVLDRQALGEEMTKRYGARLGRMEALEDPHVYPLATTWAHHFVARRAALIGDAAVGMHPVTAHGFNLGLQGATSLAELIADAAQAGRDIAGNPLLRRYETRHRLASGPLYAATNMLVRLYTDDRPAAQIARPLALRAAARLPLVRHSITNRLMQR